MTDGPYFAEGTPAMVDRVRAGYYTQRGIVALLRKHKRSPRAVQFIADMLE